MLVLPACAGSRVANQNGNDNPSATGGMIPELFLPAESDASIGGLVNYNPYAPKQQTKTWLYEPLMVQNSLDCKITPWLATGFKWEGANKLTFDIRPGVKWSDGSDFTANDVAFTFNLMKKYTGMDTAGVWSDTFGAKATAVTANGNQVVFDFSGDAASKFTYILNVLILPEKVYGSVGDPTKYVDKEPVSTGPFKIGSYNGRRLELVRRPEYWQADKIKVEKLILEGNYDANQAALKLRTGGLDFYSGELPNPQKTFVDQDPKLNHFWYAPNGLTVLAPNLTKKPFNDVKFREALAYAMDKKSATTKATYGIMDVASQSGLDPAGEGGPAAGAVPGREHDHPVRRSRRRTSCSTRPATRRAATASGPTPTVPRSASCSRCRPASSTTRRWPMSSSATSVRLGIDIKANKAAPDSVDRQKKSGDFQLMINYMGAGCDYANGMGATLSSAQFPTKTTIKGNVGRFSDPAVDAAVDELTGTTDEAKTKELVGVLVNAMMTKYPVLAILYAPARSIYRTDKAVGWPSAEDPYCNPQDSSRVWMTHLTAAPK